MHDIRDVVAACRRWASGEFSPAWNEESEAVWEAHRNAYAQLEREVAADPDSWWTALCLVSEESEYLETAENLADVLRAVLSMGDDRLPPAIEQARKSVRWRYTVYHAWESPPGNLLDLLGPDVVVADYLSAADEQDKWAEWAGQLLNDLQREDRFDDVWEFVLAILGSTQSDNAIGDIGAGPLEDLITERGVEFVDQIEREAVSNANLRKAITGARIWDLEPNLFRRFERAAGEPLIRPREGLPQEEGSFEPPAALGRAVSSAGDLIDQLKRIGISVRGVVADEEYQFQSEVEESIQCRAPDEPRITILRFVDVDARNRFLESILRNTIQLREMVLGDNWMMFLQRPETAALAATQLGALFWKPYG